MHDAHYFRSQAALFSELARRMTIPSDAEYCRVTAERHASTAVELEKHPADIAARLTGAPAIEQGAKEQS